MSETPQPLETVDERNNPEAQSAEGGRSNGTARAGGRSLPPEQLDARDAEGPDGTAAGDPLAGVTASPDDVADAVPGDTGPEHPGTR